MVVLSRLSASRTLSGAAKPLSKRTGYLPTLDGLRAFAIAAVLLDHLGVQYLQGDHDRLFSLTRIGPNGVSLFFAISGFLICYRLIEEEGIWGAIHLKGFYIRRAFRILPPALLYLGGLALLGTSGLVQVTYTELASCALFFRNYLESKWIHWGWGGYTIHFWSLAVEEHFYLIWPAIIAFGGKRRARYASIGLALLVACWRYLDFHHRWFNHLIPGLQFSLRTDVRLDGLLLGCFAALIFAEPRYRVWLTRKYSQSLWFALAFTYVAIQVIARKHLYTIFESALLAALVMGTVLRPQGVVGRILETRPLKAIGRLSYSLYLWQELFLVPGPLYPMSILQRFPVNLIAVFAISYLSYRYVERPFIRIGHRLAPPPSPGRIDIGEDVVIADGTQVASTEGDKASCQ
jgi:peptidoglycan/LPS O-acetylase OafA/YrhL